MPETYEELLKRQEKELPRLPVPPLKQTMDTFLLSTKPFLTEDEYITTEKLAKEFFCGELGTKLQNLLEERAASTRNWIADWWLNAAYLDNRKPLPVYSNTAALYPPVDLTPDFDYLRLAAAVISGNLDFKIKLMDENSLPPMKIGNFEICLDQTQYFYSTCRIPGEQRDTLRINKPSRHITVLRRNHIFMVPVYDKAGKVLNQNQIHAQLEAVVQQSEIPCETPIGVLTTEERVVWCRARQSLLNASEENRKNFDLIETGIFVASLDKALSEKELQKGGRLLGIAERSMHGGNVDISEAGNRWVDMICQLVVTESGEVGFPFEHSPVEASSVVYNYLYDFWTTNRGKDSLPPAGVYDPPQKLTFTVPQDVEALIPKAVSNVKKIAALLEVYPFSFTGFGRNFIRDLKIGSADSFVQLAIQLTFRKLHKVPGAQYETATTRGFLCGRTETIRSCTVQTDAFARSMLDPATSDLDKAKALKTAMDVHREYVMKAMMGCGIDRHLLGLKLAAQELGMTTPVIFEDPGYVRSSNMRVATSQGASKVSATATFSPLCHDGYGCCYNILPDEMAFGITAFTTCPDTSAVTFGRVLGESLYDMKALLTRLSPQ